MRRGGCAAFWRCFRRAAALVLAAVLIAGTLEPMMSLADSGAYAGEGSAVDSAEAEAEGNNGEEAAAAEAEGNGGEVAAAAAEADGGEVAAADEAGEGDGEDLLAGGAAVPFLAQAAKKVQGILTASFDAQAAASSGGDSEALREDASAGSGQEGTEEDAEASGGLGAASGAAGGSSGTDTQGAGSAGDAAASSTSGGSSSGAGASGGQDPSSDAGKGGSSVSSVTGASGGLGSSSDAAKEEGGSASTGNGEGETGAYSDEEYVPDFVEEIEPTEELMRPLLARTFKAEPDAAESSNGDYEIRSLITQLVSGAKENDEGDYVWTAGSSAAGHEFVYRVNYSISGAFEIPAGCIKIVIPKSILKNRDGEYDDYYEMSLPSTEEYSGQSEFAYYEDGDSLVITNIVEVSAGADGYFEVAYATAEETFEYADYGADNDKSDDFTAVATVSAPGTEEISKSAGSDGVYIDTAAYITGASKYIPTKYDTWRSSWGDAPEDAGGYYYLVWQIGSSICDNVTQPYNFSLSGFLTDLTEGLDGASSGDYGFVKLKMQGGTWRDYPSDDPSAYTQYGLMSGGYRYDYVVTRHKKSVYGDISYELKNTATATVDPADQVDADTARTDSATFLWDPTWGPSVGHFHLDKYGNNNWYSFKSYYWNYANYELERFRPEYEEDDWLSELSGFAYIVKTRGYPYPWTLEAGASEDDADAYGKNPVAYDTVDNSFYLAGDSEKLTADDYYISQLDFLVEGKDAEAKTDESTGKTRFVPTTVTYAEDETIDFYVQAGGSEEWIKAATYNLYSKSFAFKDENYVESAEASPSVRVAGTSMATTARIIFKENANVTGWRHVTTNAHYYTQITAIPWVVLKNSEYVMGKVTGKDSIRLKNVADVEYTYAGEVKTGETIMAMENTASDYARVSYYSSSITKSVTSGKNDVLKQQCTIGWKADVYETITGGQEGQTEYIYQDGGTFYDLLPAGAVFDPESLSVEAGLTNRYFTGNNARGSYLSSGEYDAETIENFNGTGRTLLVIRITTPAYWYRAYYDTVHSWESIDDYGRVVENRVVYETGNERITDGVDAGGLEGLDSDFAGFERGEKAYLYADAASDINALTAAVSGLSKKVRGGSGDYSYSAETTPDGTYSYKLRYQNTYMNSSTNLVFFDSLENYDLYDEELESGWTGVLAGVDVSQLVQAGISPKVYISAQEDFDIEDYYAAHADADTGKVEFDPEVWTEVGASDLSNAEALLKARAIAIDMTQAADGSDFALNAGEPITAVLYMKAPHSIAGLENLWTYNNVYISDTVADAVGGSENILIHQDYTKLKFHVVADIAAYKVSSEDAERYISGTTFRLTGTSDYGTEVDEYATSNSKGRIIFKDVESGTYALAEYACGDDWQLPQEPMTVVIDSEGKVFIDGTEVTEDGFLASDAEEKYKIENDPRHHADIYFDKKDLNDSTIAVAGARFRLSGRSDYGSEVLLYAVSDESGRVTFENVEEGTYELAEVEAPKRYVTSGTAFKAVVDANGNFAISGDGCEYTKTGIYNIYNEPIHSFYFLKKDAYNLEPLGGAEFRLYGASADGEPYDETVTSVEGTGYVTFENLKAGSYILEETKTPDHDGITYVADGAKHIVTVAADGTVTMDGTVIWPYAGEDAGEETEENDPADADSEADDEEEAGEAADAAAGTAAGGAAEGASAAAVDGPNRSAAGSGSEADAAAGMAANGASNAAAEEEGAAQSDYSEAGEGADALAASASASGEGVYVWYNTRNRGQITVTKRWNDGLTNEQRVEPVVYISTQKLEVGASKAYFRTADDEKSIIDYAADGKTVTAFKRNTSLSEAEVKARGAVRIDNQYDKENVKYKIYGWVDDDGTFYWWTNAELGVLPSDLSYYFYNEADLASIDWSGIAKSSFWTGEAGAETLTESVSNMAYMFYGCSGISSIDISWIDNSGITRASDMKYAFGNNTSKTPAGTMDSLEYIKIGENYHQYGTSVWKGGTWRNNDTGVEYWYTELTGTLVPGTYEYIGVKVKYAVQIYGIQQDTDAGGETLGLTFGPATGASYVDSYVTHAYEDAGDGTYYVLIVTHAVAADGSETESTAYLTDASGNKVTRTAEEKAKYDVDIHEMSWSEVAAQSKSDPTVFRDCMLCGDTKSVEISLGSKLASGSTYAAYGDGSVLYNTVKSTYRTWNNSDNDREGDSYSGSRIRATLVGKDEYTNTGDDYAGSDAPAASESLYSCLDSELQGLIAAKEVTTVKGKESSFTTSSTYDKLWLFSPAEMCGNYYKWDGLEGLAGSDTASYQKFNDTESAYFVSTTYSRGSNRHRVVYTEAGSKAWWWLRPPVLRYTGSARGVRDDGYIIINSYLVSYSGAIGFGFCLR